MIDGCSESCEFERDMNLRQWLIRQGRVIDRVECLHIFRQILDFVDLAHSEGFVLRNIRPSCFILSDFNRVAFIDSGTTISSSDRSSERSTGRAAATFPRDGSGGRQEADIELTSFPGEEVRPNNSTTQQGGFGNGSGSEAVGLEQIVVQYDRRDSRSRISREDAAGYGWGGSSTQRWGRAWSGSSSGSQWSGDMRVATRAAGGLQSAQTCSSGGRSGENRSWKAVRDSSGEEALPNKDQVFPLRRVLRLEQIWYASPEDDKGGTYVFASDIYCLGVLFFELFFSVNTEAERVKALADLRNRILHPRLLSECPKEASFCLWLLHPDPSCRPKAREILQCDLFSEAREALAERQAAINLDEREADVGLLSDFLLRVQLQRQEIFRKLSTDLDRLQADIDEVKRRRMLFKQRGEDLAISEPAERLRFPAVKEEGFRAGKSRKDSMVGWSSGLNEVVPMKTGILGKRMRELDGPPRIEQTGERVNSLECQAQLRCDRDKNSKSARLMDNFAHLERVYFATRWKVPQSVFKSGKASSGHSSQAGGSSIGAVGGCNAKAGDQACFRGRGKSSTDDWLGCFFDSLCKYARYSHFEVKAALRHGDLLNTANMVCSLSFDRDEEYFATAGVCKQIKIFECEAVLNEHVDIHYPVVEMTSRSKLSSICWNSYIKSHIASSDYEGVVQLWDANTSKTLMEYDEHEKRAWSVDFSQGDPTKLASGSDDGSVKLWSINQETSVGTINSRANVCCVQFPPDTSHLLVCGSADYKIYCYDLRNTKVALAVLAGHSKTVSFVKFVDSMTLVSASTDNTLKLWDLSQAASNHGANASAVVTYTGHTNEKNFVGLSVADGYIACGSEKNAVFAYHKSLPMPMASHKFGCVDPVTGFETEDDNGQFVSSVCWRGKSQTLVTANSMGNIKILEMV